MSDTLRLTVNRRYGTLSPLRYPGGKATLAGLFEDVFSALNLDLPTYVEPYAGGAGAGIALLREGLIERLVINDIDPAVNAFWNVILGDTDRFIKQISSIPLTVDEWRRQRETYRMGENADKFDLGIAFFYLKPNQPFRNPQCRSDWRTRPKRQLQDRREVQSGHSRVSYCCIRRAI